MRDERAFDVITKGIWKQKSSCPRQPNLEVIRERDRLIEQFGAGTTARMAARLCGVNRKTEVFYSHRLREIIALELVVLAVHEF